MAILDVTEDEIVLTDEENQSHHISADITTEYVTKESDNDVIIEDDEEGEYMKTIVNSLDLYFMNQNNSEENATEETSRPAVPLFTKCRLCNDCFRDIEFIRKHIIMKHTN